MGTREPGSATKGMSPTVTFKVSRPSKSPGETPASLSTRRSSRHNTTFTSMLQTPSGPVLTPKGDRNQSMILLSPSRTIGESLTTLASSTAQQLEEVWDEVGYNPEERASQLSDLLVKFRNLCDEKIMEERGVAETFREEIANAKKEYQEKASALKSMIDPHLLREENGQTLTDQLSTLETALESLREDAAVARADLEQCRTFLEEAHDALGFDMDPKWKDVESDLTMEKRSNFHLKVVEMRDEINSRTSAVVRLLQDCQELMHDLRMDPQREGTELDRQIAGSLVRSKDGSFIMASKFSSETCTGIGSTILEDLSNRLAQLSEEKQRRKQRIQDMGLEISMLWEKLRVSEEDQKAFTQSVQGLSMETIEKGEQEILRLHALKSEMLGNLLQEARETITDLWEETNAAEDQRQAFAPFFVTDESLFDDNLLDKHEDYIASLEARLEQMRPILRLIERREEILEERMEYDQLQKNSDRLKKRGADLTKQLMKEEKMAKRIKRELPKLTAMLEEKLLIWKREHGENFQFHGEAYLEVMSRQEAEWKQYKENEMHAKLKKKQEERAQVEKRFGPSHAFKSHHGKRKGQPKPFGDARNKENTRVAM